MRSKRLLVCGLVLLLLLGCARGTAPVASPASTAKPATASQAPAGSLSLAGKTITIVAPTAPGGSVDLVSRFYSRYMPRFLPGNPTVVVRNIPGGGGIVGPNYVYTARPDGLTLLLGSASTMSPDLLRQKAVQFDLRKMPAIISMPIEPSFFFARAGILSKPEELVTDKARALTFGYHASLSAFIFVALKELLDMPIGKVILGYEGGADARRAFVSGEINITNSTAAEYRATVAGQIKSGEVIALFQTGAPDDKGNLVRAAYLPNVVTFDELFKTIRGKSPSGPQYDAFRAMRAAMEDFGRVLFLPPGTPDSVARVHWAAAEKMVKDQEFQAAGKKIFGDESEWVAGEAMDKRHKKDYGMQPEVVTWLRTTLAKYGVVVD